MIALSEYEKQRQRPSGLPVMHQNWRDLLFLHFSSDPAEVQKLLPAELTVDTLPDENGHERAWVGLVPFRMEGIRPRRLPAFPWLSAFPETNVRTYVHREGKSPGVWFFSLDAARWLACQVARRSYALPYLHARMKTEREGSTLRYKSRRLEANRESLEIIAEIGDAIPAPQPGSLEFFLVERYLLYSLRGGKMFTGRVYHEPYSLRTARVKSESQTLVEAVGLECKPWEHVCFSDGVDVEVWPLRAERGS